MEDTRKRQRSVKKVLEASKELPREMWPAFDLLKALNKGEILRLRDDFRPYMATRDWVFQDLFKGGGVFLHHEGEGFLEVKVKDIDWAAYKKKKR
jgi:hypothetical protein